jgi:hypothetical protein
MIVDLTGQVAYAVVFLASSRASYVSGHTCSSTEDGQRGRAVPLVA